MYSIQYSDRSFQAHGALPQVSVTLEALESISIMLKPSRTASIVSAYFSHFWIGFLHSGQIIFWLAMASLIFWSDMTSPIEFWL